MTFWHDHNTELGVNLASARLGASVTAVSDEFFAPACRMLDDSPPLFIPDRYDEHGKWMDGWESRRKRDAGYDWAIVKLAVAGVVTAIDVDTTHFTGNYAPAIAIDLNENEVTSEAAPGWKPLAPPTLLSGDSHHQFQVDSTVAAVCLRVRIFPDGGIARFRVYGRPVSQSGVRGNEEIETSSALHGGHIIAYSDAHFGSPESLLWPDRGRDMGDGWETCRRRAPGFDWCIIQLGMPTRPQRLQIDTAHFKGNYPYRVSVHGAAPIVHHSAALVAESIYWPILLPETGLGADEVFSFNELSTWEAITHVRLNMIPDGGISRFRLLGFPVAGERAQ